MDEKPARPKSMKINNMQNRAWAKNMHGQNQYKSSTRKTEDGRKTCTPKINANHQHAEQRVDEKPARPKPIKIDNIQTEDERQTCMPNQ